MTNDIKIKPINRTKQNRNEDGVQGGATLWKLLIELSRIEITIRANFQLWNKRLLIELSRIEIMRNDPEDGVQCGY